MTSWRLLRGGLGIAVVVGSVAVAHGGQAWKQGRTPDGQPDIQGIWLNFDSTPFEAPDPKPAARG